MSGLHESALLRQVLSTVDGHDPRQNEVISSLVAHLDSDAAFAVKPELVCHPVRRDAGEGRRWQLDELFEEIEFDLRMVPLDWAPGGGQTEEEQ